MKCYGDCWLVGATGISVTTSSPAGWSCSLLSPAWVLPQEKVRDWTQRFGGLGITCRELTGAQGAHLETEGTMNVQHGPPACWVPACSVSVERHSQRSAVLNLDRSLPPIYTCAGDTDHEGLEGLDSADIICATPEKFDAVTRSGMRFFADIGLVLIGGCWNRTESVCSMHLGRGSQCISQNAGHDAVGMP